MSASAAQERRWLRALLVPVGGLLVGCLTELTPEPGDRVGSLPIDPPVPERRPLTKEKVELGRLLFWDPILSGHLDVACATCHHPTFGYGDGRDLSVGAGGLGLGPDRRAGVGLVPRNAPTVVNAAWNGMLSDQRNIDPEDAPMFWDNRTHGLERQALEPIRSRVEMLGDAYTPEDAIPAVLARLDATPGYVERFELAFGSGPITADALAEAIASFQRSLVAPWTSFDRYARGEQAALTPAQKRGMRLFLVLGCSGCHSGPMFSDFALHRLGTDPHPADPVATPNVAVRTPTLRHVARTAPYMHNGTLATLEDVMRFYQDLSFGRRPHADRADPDIAGIAEVTSFEFDDVIAFLRALSDGDVDEGAPVSVPSGLRPGGTIE